MLKERNLPLNIITKSSERNQRLKLFALVTLLLLGLILLLLFVNYSFPTLQNIYGLNNDFEVGAPLKIDVSFVSSSTNQSQTNGVESKHDEAASMPVGFNRFVTPSSSLPLTTNASKQIWLDFCNLTDLDPWDSSIIKFIKPQKDHLLNCTRKVFEHSKLINGQLFIYSNESMNCQMRCLFSNGDRQIIYGIVNNVINGTKPECDIVEVECHFDGDYKEREYQYYKYLHAQIHQKLPPSSFPKPPEKYDVHIIILDSVSQTQFIRSLPKTIYMLRERYEAIPFQNLNKVGTNSYPNGFAFLMGKMINDIPVSPFSKGYFGDYKSKHEICKIPLDNEQFIGFRFKDDGYVTMMSEDWKNGVFMWPNCIGFKETPVDHYMKPFQHRLEKREMLQTFKMENVVHKDSCREAHHDIMDYLKEFLKSYPDKPKFSISWMSVLTHNFQNSLSRADDYFYNFFNDTKKDFDNSFLFVMGDHGLRFGKSRQTKLGEIEDNNPALFLSVPKSLRNNPTFMQQLRINSKELITHFDIYATLTEIAQPKNPRIPKPLLHGSSLFHPLPTPRTCDSLRIPFEFCKCRSKKIVLPKNNQIGIKAAKLMIEQMNLNLTTSADKSNLCSKLSLKENGEIIVEDYGGEQIERIYKITFSTIPGNGKFWGIISFDPLNKKIQIISSKFLRLNSYGKQAKCAIKSDFASYCFCIIQ